MESDTPIRIIRESELVQMAVVEAKLPRLQELITRLAYGQTLTQDEIVFLYEVHGNTKQAIQFMQGWLSDQGVDLATVVVP